jgi:hypothetical protein
MQASFILPPIYSALLLYNKSHSNNESNHSLIGALAGPNKACHFTINESITTNQKGQKSGFSVILAALYSITFTF